VIVFVVRDITGFSLGRSFVNCSSGCLPETDVKALRAIDELSCK
jgi:hypothetical protein